MRAVFVSAAVAFIVAIVCTPIAIKLFTRLRAGQPIREEGPRTHLSKKGTPTMGGVVLIVATIVAYVAGHFVLATLPEEQLGTPTGITSTGVVLLGLFVGLGLVGFIDDFLKVRKRHSGGLSARGKLLGQILVGAVFGVVALWFPSTMTDATGAVTNTETVGSTMLSFIRDIPALDVTKIGAVIIFIFVVMAATNGVNLTDGLDGLAAGSATFAFAAFVVIGFWAFRYPDVYDINHALDLAVVAAAMLGAITGFLWWNAAPAQIFMGDTGSLAIGAGLACLALTTNTALLLPIIGGVFVIETLSVILQVASFRLFGGRRIFRMAPLHHHFELLGWPETTVIIRFWILAGLCLALGLGLFYADFLSTGLTR